MNTTTENVGRCGCCGSSSSSSSSSASSSSSSAGPGRCCVNDVCNPSVTTKEECESCDRLIQCVVGTDENGECPPGFSPGGLYPCVKAVADCSECLPTEFCVVDGPTGGVCGTWLADGDDCTPPPKCWDSACISGMPVEFYGGTFRVGDYPGLPASSGGYRGPYDPDGTFAIDPTACGSWRMTSRKRLQGTNSYLYIEALIGGGCLERKGLRVDIYIDGVPPSGRLWQTVTIDITPGECPAGDGEAEGENPLP